MLLKLVSHQEKVEDWIRIGEKKIVMKKR